MFSVTIAQVDNWRAAPREHQTLEFKQAKNQFDLTDLYKYCVAIANEGDRTEFGLATSIAA